MVLLFVILVEVCLRGSMSLTKESPISEWDELDMVWQYVQWIGFNEFINEFKGKELKSIFGSNDMTEKGLRHLMSLKKRTFWRNIDTRLFFLRRFSLEYTKRIGDKDGN